MKITFPERGRSGRFVLTIKNLEFGYGNNVSEFFNEIRKMVAVLNFLFFDYCVHTFLE